VKGNDFVLFHKSGGSNQWAHMNKILTSFFLLISMIVIIRDLLLTCLLL